MKYVTYIFDKSLVNQTLPSTYICTRKCYLTSLYLPVSLERHTYRNPICDINRLAINTTTSLVPSNILVTK